MNDLCSAIRGLLQDHLDGELAPPEAQRVQAHLAACAACRRLAAGYQRLFAALEQPAVPRPAPGLAQRVLQRVHVARQRRRRLQTLVGAAAVAALCIAAIFLTGYDAPAVAWGHLADLARVELWSAVSDAFTELGLGIASAADASLDKLPGTTLLAAAVAALFAVNLALAYRWRTLARANGHAEARR